MLRVKIWNSPYVSFLWFCIISLGSFTEAPEVNNLSLSDKWLHFICYGIFSFLLFGSTYFYLKILKSKLFRSIIVFVLASLVGITIEIVQHFFIPLRVGDYLDVVANSLGIIGGLFTALILKRIGAL